ncbi:MAG: hypothetical protein AMJ94_07910 [Deltaproteobacteria bacterium SM23_61]|nr:MAG: hypothetical protein AMJ94_07910 [Deltaproteobacteria bacterium SM23_61]
MDSGALAWLPQGIGSRPPFGKPNPRSDPDNKIIIRREPMKEQTPRYVLPGAGCTPWAVPGTYRLGSKDTGLWKIDRNRLLNWEKSLFFILH